jgi:hypothetical protein
MTLSQDQDNPFEAAMTAGRLFMKIADSKSEAVVEKPGLMVFIVIALLPTFSNPITNPLLFPKF